MRISRSAAYALSALAAAALLAACSGSGGSQSTGYSPTSGVGAPMGAHLPGLPNHSQFPANTAVKTPNVHRDHHKSWVSPDVKLAPRLLFVADDDTDDVYIFTMPAMALKGTLTGFSEPQGMCQDGSGNIWVTNTETSQIFQYSRTGTLLKTLDDPDEYPVGCAVNKSNGDLAVTNIISTTGGVGNVEIYADATGTPTAVTNPDQYEYFFPAYDPSGNLYFDGESTSFTFILSELPSGSSSAHTLSISGGTLYFPGGVNWDRVGGNLVVGDQECGDAEASCQYAMTVSGSTATITGSTSLTDTNGGGCDVDQGTLAPFSRYFAGGCISDSSAASVAARWAYPAGGDPTNSSTDVEFPIGSAISNK
jgi:NHL repeat